MVERGLEPAAGPRELAPEPAAVVLGLVVAPLVVAVAPELAQVVAPRVLGLVREPVVAEPRRNKTN